METITFKELLNENNTYGITNIVIPKIQRSYAQGRPDSHATKTRERFLKSIHNALTANKQLTLDFIYGNVSNGTLIPLDGQQRLTTLWLLHWYAAKKKMLDAPFLVRFSYNTRYSARDFLKRLSDFTPSFSGSLKDEICDQGWFPMEWINDPTVVSMLAMLDAIDDKFAKIEELWDKLDLIRFYFLSIDEMQLTDDIYIKMNSRGKPLTEFEHFKAEFLKVIRDIDPDTAKRIGRKIDIDWTDMLWPYRDANNIIDDEFLRYFLLICHIILYRHDRSLSEISGFDYFDIIDNLFTGEQAADNLDFMEKAFDCWTDIHKSGTPISKFFDSYLSASYAPKKAVPLDSEHRDIFETCLKNYPFERKRPSSQQWITTIYAFLTYLFNKDQISDDDFRRRLRIVLNLQKNSGNEVVDTPKGDAGNRMPAILKQVERIITKGVVEPAIEIDGTTRHNFSMPQLNEEKDKLEFTTEHPELAEQLFQLEDHELLTGRIGVVGLNYPQLHQRFINLFANCSLDAIDCALLATDNYSQRKNDWLIQLGSGNNDLKKAWLELFHPTEKTRNFDRTAAALNTLLSGHDQFDDNILRDIAKQYEDECRTNKRFDWRYYYLHYPEFRANRYGKYTQHITMPYEIVALHSEKNESSKAYQCFLKCIGNDIYNIRALEVPNGYLRCNNDSFTLHGDTVPEAAVIKELKIPQVEGIDTVDRIEFYKNNPL